LIVDDNAEAANALSVLLRYRGHEVQIAYDARDALKCVQSFRPDVALLDIGLPEMDGYELAQRLRADPALNDIRLVALTGYAQAEDRQRAHAVGFDDHLVKPVRLAAIERTLAAVSAG
jgi:CheY-like chemotaxis protein